MILDNFSHPQNKITPNYEKIRTNNNPIYLPINLCNYCKTENYAFGIQCKQCGVRVKFNENIKSNAKENIKYSKYKRGLYYKKVERNSEEWNKIENTYKNNKIWICNCGVSNFNLGKDNTPNCEGCGDTYIEGENMLPLDVLNGIGFSDNDSSNDVYELRKRDEIIFLWQEALIKIIEIDLSNSNKDEYSKIIKKINYIKEHSKTIDGKGGKTYKDGNQVIDFLKKYLNEDKKTIQIISEKKDHIFNVINRPENTVKKNIGLSVPILVYLMFIQNFSVNINKKGLYSISQTIVDKKGWIKKEYISKIETPEYNFDKKTIRYVLTKENIGIKQYNSDKEEFINNDNFIDLGKDNTLGNTIELGVGEYGHGINGACATIKAAAKVLEILLENSDGGSSNGGGGSSPSKSGGGGMGFRTGGSFSQNDIPYKMLESKFPQYTGFEYLAGGNLNYISGFEIGYPNSSDFVNVDDNCFEKYEKTIKVKEKITKHKYQIYDWDNNLQKKYTKTVRGIKQVYPNIKVDNIDSKKIELPNYSRILKIDYNSILIPNRDDTIVLDYYQAKSIKSDTGKLKCKLSVFNILFRVKSEIKNCILLNN